MLNLSIFTFTFVLHLLASAYAHALISAISHVYVAFALHSPCILHTAYCILYTIDYQSAHAHMFIC